MLVSLRQSWKSCSWWPSGFGSALLQANVTNGSRGTLCSHPASSRTSNAVSATKLDPLHEGEDQGANEPCIGEELRHSEEQWQLRHEFSMQPMLRTISADKRKERSLVQVNSLAKKIPEGESDIHDVPSV